MIRGLINEISHLLQLAPPVPLPIPSPTYIGEPSSEYRWPFYGAPFLAGRELAEAVLDHGRRAALARPSAEFLRTPHHARLGADLPLDPPEHPLVIDEPDRHVPALPEQAQSAQLEIGKLRTDQPPRERFINRTSAAHSRTRRVASLPDSLDVGLDGQ